MGGTICPHNSRPIQAEKYMQILDANIMDDLLKHTYSGSMGRVGFDRNARVRQDRRSEVIQKSPRAGEIAFVARFTLHTDHSGGLHAFPKAEILIAGAEWRRK